VVSAPDGYRGQETPGCTLSNPDNGRAKMPAVRTIVAIVNQKGGVGKSTTAINLAAYLAGKGERILVVDMDPQGNATSGLGVSPGPGGCMSYDRVLLDCPPSLDLLTLNALTAADEVLIPIQCEYYALEGLTQLMQSIRMVREELNPGLEVGGVLLTMFDPRTNLARQVADEVRSFFGERVFHTIVPRNVRLSEAPSFGMPIALYAPKSTGAEAYSAVADEVVNRG
jgi:cellulose biosynthesis protein BcsQ